MLKLKYSFGQYINLICLFAVHIRSFLFSMLFWCNGIVIVMREKRYQPFNSDSYTLICSVFDILHFELPLLFDIVLP